MDASPSPAAPPTPGHRPAPGAPGHRPAPDGPEPPSGPPPAPGGHLPATAPPAGQPGPFPPVRPPAPAPASRLRRTAAPAGVMAGVLAAFALVGSVDPNEPGHYPVCPLLRFTGIYCPGCGGLRSAYAVAHGDLGTAFGSNAPAVIGYGIFAVVWVLWMVRAAAGKPARFTPRPVHWWAIGAVLLIFTVVRNLPFGSALAP
ncbi:DUF2752 domain-containing protein [Streptomyces sp. NPDC092903]|uniref:DUF2752 domain-containing protein n=1 Tax=Streptomyces sp. NPDC092903 TaxID=3366017 RepID=UPI0037FAC64C